MRIEYESPKMEIFKFSLSTCVLASNTDESKVEEGTKFTIDEEIDPFGD